MIVDVQKGMLYCSKYTEGLRRITIDPYDDIDVKAWRKEFLRDFRLQY